MLVKLCKIDFEKVKESLENEFVYSQESLPNSMRLREYGFPSKDLMNVVEVEMCLDNVLESLEEKKLFIFEFENKIYFSASGGIPEGIFQISDLYNFYKFVGRDKIPHRVEKYTFLENRYKNLEELTK